MNKQRYLAELQRLLVFMTEEDRELTVQRYGELFDVAGPEGETALVERIGSPTKAAISLSRGYEPGALEGVLPKPETPAEPEPEPAPEPEKEPAPQGSLEELWEELDEFQLPELDIDLPGEEKPARTEESAPEPEPEPEEEPALRELNVAPIRPPKAPEPERRTKVVYKRIMPIGLGAVLFTILMIGIGIPLAAVCVALAAACLCPGAAAAVGAWLVFVGGLWCVSYMADAILMFGLSFIVLAVAVLLLFAGIWADTQIIRLYIRGVDALGGLLLGRKVTVDA
ncbi:MAG: hypothetical protein LUH36_10105 [Oscillospiraceae bacterium]|nr:hypothetical protein [Oscillospiraceae bacterium]